MRKQRTRGPAQQNFNEVTFSHRSAQKDARCRPRVPFRFSIKRGGFVFCIKLSRPRLRPPFSGTFADFT